MLSSDNSSSNRAGIGVWKIIACFYTLLLVVGFVVGCGVMSQSTEPSPIASKTGTVAKELLPSDVPTVASQEIPPGVGTYPPGPIQTTVSASNTPVPQVTATFEAWMTAVSTYGPIIPDPNEEAQRAEARAFRSLFSLPGTVIAQGTNATPTGRYNLLTYRVEEVVLPGPTTFTRRTVGNMTVDRVWRFIVSGGPFPIGATPVSLFLNGNIITSGGEGATEATFLVFDRSLLQEGATIAVSYHGDLADSTLPETLHFAP